MEDKLDNVSKGFGAWEEKLDNISIAVAPSFTKWGRF